MEILPLIQSNALPMDLIMGKIYPQLCKLKSPLSNELKESILHDHFHLKKVIMHYYNDSGLSRKPNDDDYFMGWLVNDLIGVLNDNQALMHGISDNLKSECPWMTLEYLLDYKEDKLHEKLYDLWKIMTPEKKMNMYHSLF